MKTLVLYLLCLTCTALFGSGFTGGGGGGGGVTDHGALTGLGDDDHTQYPLLLGRSGGQTLIGGTAASNDLTLQSTSNATRGQIVLSDDAETGDGTGLTFINSSSPNFKVTADANEFGLLFDGVESDQGAYHVWRTQPNDGGDDIQMYFNGKDAGAGERHDLGIGYNAFSSPPSYVLQVNEPVSGTSVPLLIAYRETGEGFPGNTVIQIDENGATFHQTILDSDNAFVFGNTTDHVTSLTFVGDENTVSSQVVTFKIQDAASGDQGNSLTLEAGESISTDKDSGDITIKAADHDVSGAANTVAGGTLNLRAGDAGQGDAGGGDVVIASGVGRGTSDGGDVTFSGGASVGTGAGGNVSFNAGAGTPDGTIKFNGGVVQLSSRDVSLTADDQSVTVDRSTLRISSDSGTPTDRTFTLTAPSGTTDTGVRLLLIFDGANAAELLDTGTACLSADWSPGDTDTLSLIYENSSACWAETARSNN